MKELILGTSTPLSVPANATNVVIFHEWGNVSVNYATVTGGGTYNWTPSSIGVHRIYFVNNLTQTNITSPPNPSKLDMVRYVVSGGTLTSVQSFLNPAPDAVIDTTTTNVTTSKLQATSSASTIVGNILVYTVINQLISLTDFLNDFSQYSNNSNFDYTEKKIRLVIEKFTQQKFGPYIGKTLMIQGEGGNELHVDYPVLYMKSITDQYGQDLTMNCQISTESPFFIHHQPDVVWLDKSVVGYGYIDRKRDVSYRSGQFFSNKLCFFLTGDFGYYDIPEDVVEAAKLLIADEFSGINEARKRGYKSAQLGDYSYTLDGSTTTGNMHADMLLSPYVSINLGLA